MSIEARQARTAATVRRSRIGPSAPEPEKARVVKDAHGNVLVDGDVVMLIKDLPLKGSSQVLKGGTHNPHKLQGIGAGLIPAIYDANVVDRVIDVTWEDAQATARRLSKEEGIFVGISSGAICWAAIEVAKELGAGKRVVVVLPDTGERYLSTALFEYTDLVNQPATTPQMLAAAAK